MMKRKWVAVLLLAGGLSCLSQAVAQTPVPTPKPLGQADAERFVSGVDSPPAKPAPNSGPQGSGGRRATNGDSARCDIPGALLEPVGSLSGALKGSPMDDEACGIEDAVSFTGVLKGGREVSFPAPVIVSCEFAKVLTEWLRLDVLPAAARLLQSRVERIGSGPGYQCRRRNNLPDGKLSEHALGKALDISHFLLEGGARVSVEDDWPAETSKGEFLNVIHGAACRRFTTVLGPEADPSHKSHFHLDIGCHGRDCTYLICQ